MDLGRELVASALREGTLRPFMSAGLTGEWLTDPEDMSRAAIFDDGNLQAWHTIVGHWNKHGKVPSVELFERSYPAETYQLPEARHTTAELIEIAQHDRRRYLVQLAASDFADIVGDGRVDDAVAFMEHTNRVIRKTYTSDSIVVTWDSPDYDVEGRIHREVKRGVGTGIPGLDSQFHGFQPGNLICYLGRAKAGKTSFALMSALEAWAQDKSVLVLSFEIAAGKDPDEPGIADRLDCFGAGVNLISYMQGEMTREEQKKLRDFRAACTEETFRIIQPTGKYTVADLEADIDEYRPDIVYVDGFYFMYDPESGKSGSNWEGHDNIASDLKRLAMDARLPIVITHQVREKQLQGKKGAGIDDGAMMGGTGIIMFADMVLGFDVNDNKLHTVSCTRSRLLYLSTIFGTWDWSTCTFSEQAETYDESEFDYGRDGKDASV